MKTVVILICYILLTNYAITQNLKSNGSTLQRQPVGFFDLQKNTVGNIDFITSNYGIFGLNIPITKGGVFWPRNSQNQYIFGSGLWIGTMREHGGLWRKYVSVTYNPNNGRSWYVPGRIEDGYQAVESDLFSYRTFFSTDFQENGEPLNPEDGSNWPIWEFGGNNLHQENCGIPGFFIYNNEKRKFENYPFGPVFISEEDVFTTYKDTDLDYYDGGSDVRNLQGYPLGLQIEQFIYSFGFSELSDILFIRYDIINTSEFELSNTWIGYLIDTDLGKEHLSQTGASNDITFYYKWDEDLNLAVAMTKTDKGELGEGFGYLGVSALLTPAIDQSGYLLNDSFNNRENQIGVVTFSTMPLYEDVFEDNTRYNFMSSGIIDDRTDEGDKRIFLSTGPFNMKSKDTVSVIYQITFANTSKGSEADGTKEDLQELVRKVKVGRDFFYENRLTDLENEDNTAGLDISQNPANGLIKLTTDLPGKKQVKLYDMRSNIVLELNTLNLKEIINISHLPNGLYFIVVSNSYSAQSGKMVVVK